MRKFLDRFKPARLVLAGLLALCLSTLSFAASPVLDRVIENGVLKVAMSADQPPFNTLNRSKAPMGYDVDLANAMAAAMQVKLEIVQLPFGDLMSALQSGKADMIMSGMEITPERTKQANFIGPYTLSGKSMLSTNAVMSTVTSGADFNNAKMRLLALEGSTSATFVTRNLPEASLKTIANYEEGIQLLISGEAEAMVADMPVCKLSILRNPDAGLATLAQPMSIAPVGIAIASGDQQFENLVSNYLRTFEKMGLTGQLHKKWFENSGWIASMP
ncbi:MAG: transporter substrate-binding domain-containing protein [Pseudomonadales bacterium]